MFETILKTGGIPSFCSAHPAVLREVLHRAKSRKVLIESTSNQVNQYGGYTGMTPERFVAYVRSIAADVGFAVKDIILGGDHLGPHVWQDEASSVAMQKSAEMLRGYVHAGFTKLHLDCSMRLADDPAGSLPSTLIAQRAAQLAQVAEVERTHFAPEGGFENLWYVIGTEVPVPGGAVAHEDGVRVTRPEDVGEMIESHRQAFYHLGLHQAWERVIAVVVQPGVEYGDDFVLAYQPDEARELSAFIECQGIVYEAHSTDYQTRTALGQMVRDHFAILKVGPGLTFAYREAIFALAFMENELIGAADRSNLFTVLENLMLRYPDHWQKYYAGNASEQAFKRKFSLSDRIRYYWGQPEVQDAVERLMKNLSSVKLPLSLISQFASQEYSVLIENTQSLTPENIVSARISQVLDDYWDACDTERNLPQTSLKR